MTEKEIVDACMRLTPEEEREVDRWYKRSRLLDESLSREQCAVLFVMMREKRKEN